MQLSEIRINLCGEHGGRLKAFCSLTFDDSLVIRDVKLIQGNEGLFLAMPSRKLADRCNRCGDKNHLRARFCNSCGSRLDESRHLKNRNGNGVDRFKLHADVAHPVNAATRIQIERQVPAAYEQEVQRSREPGYVPPQLSDPDDDLYELEHSRAPLRPTGTGGR